MSVLIKGMEMPKAGNWKTVRIYSDGTCATPNWQGDCTVRGEQAVSLPKKHGRLIDADALCEGLVSNHAVVIYAKSAPTIIPAEEGE